MIAIARPVAQAKGLISVDNRRIIGATAVVGLSTLLVKLTALAREIVTANHLGTTDAKDASLSAWLVPGFLVLIISGAISGAMIPALVDARIKRGTRRSRAVFSEVMLVATAVLLIVPAILLLVGPWVLPLFAPSYSPEKLDLTYDLMTIMAPAIPLIGIATVWSALMNSDDRFLAAAASPVLVPLCSMLALIAVPSHDVRALAIGFTVGAALYFAAMAWAVSQTRLGSRPRWHGGLPESRSVAHQFWPLAANGLVFGGMGVVDQVMAASLGPGEVSVLSYGAMLVVPLIGIGSAALATTIFPYFSRLVTLEDWDGLRATLRTFCGLVLLVTIPLMLALITLSDEIVRVVFERGQFSTADTASVARVQAIYALVIPIQAVATLMSRLVVSLGATRLMLIGSIAIFAMNIVGDLLLKEWIGVEGIVIATVLTQVFSLAFLSVLWRRVVRTRSMPQ